MQMDGGASALHLAKVGGEYVMAVRVMKPLLLARFHGDLTKEMRQRGDPMSAKPAPLLLACVALVSCLSGLSLWVPAAASAERPMGDDDMPADESNRTIEFMAFSKSGKEFAIKVKDDMQGESFEVYDSKKSTLIKAYGYDEGGEKGTWRKVKHKYDLTNEPVEGGENPKKGVTVLGNPKDGQLQLYITNGEKIRKYASIKLPVVKIRRKKKQSKGSVKEIVFDQKGKYFVVVYHQKVPGTFERETDSVASFKFKAYKARFAGGDGE